MEEVYILGFLTLFPNKKKSYSHKEILACVSDAGQGVVLFNSEHYPEVCQTNRLGKDIIRRPYIDLGQYNRSCGCSFKAIVIIRRIDKNNPNSSEHIH